MHIYYVVTRTAAQDIQYVILNTYKNTRQNFNCSHFQYVELAMDSLITGVHWGKRDNLMSYSEKPLVIACLAGSPYSSYRKSPMTGS